MTDVSPADAARSLDHAQAARNATWNAAAPPRPARLIAIFVGYIIVMTLMWWLFSRDTAFGWIGGLALCAAFVATLAFLERRNPKARPAPSKMPFKQQIVEALDPKFICIILLSVLPGLWIVDNQPRLVVIALIVTAEALLSVPLVVLSRREMHSKPV